MPIFATAGTKLFIGGVLDGQSADLTEASFNGQTWVEVKNPESLGSVGDEAEQISFDDLSSKRRKKLKGVRDAGIMEVIAGIDYSDPGQIAALAAEKANGDYAFKVVFDDAPAGGTPSERLFSAAVGSAREALETANNVMKLQLALWVNSNVVRKNAAPAPATGGA